MGHAEAVFGADAAAEPRSFARRVVGAVRLEPETWDEITSDGGTLGQAGMVVLLAAAAGGLVAAALEGGSRAVVESCLATLATWPLVAGLLWAAANVAAHRLALGTALRLVGFAMAPLTLIGLAAIPIAPLQAVVRLLALALFFAALVAGTRQALRIDTMRAALLCALAGGGLFFLTVIVVAFTVSGA
jgi:hypothetical protein